jgi:hypothetical protein
MENQEWWICAMTWGQNPVANGTIQLGGLGNHCCEKVTKWHDPTGMGYQWTLKRLGIQSILVVLVLCLPICCYLFVPFIRFIPFQSFTVGVSV